MPYLAALQVQTENAKLIVDLTGQVYPAARDNRDGITAP
jgi:hypothetical protein